MKFMVVVPHIFFYTSSLFFSQQTVFNMLVIFCHLLKDKCQLFSYILPLLERLIRTEELVRRWREIVSFLFINIYIHIWKSIFLIISPYYQTFYFFISVLIHFVLWFLTIYYLAAIAFYYYWTYVCSCQSKVKCNKHVKWIQ